jgi:biotin carboxylase
MWLVDASAFGDSGTQRLLRRFGPVIDIGGMSDDAAVRAIAPHRPNGIVTYFDTGMMRIARIAEDLGLPFADSQTALRLVDKVHQRDALRAAGIAVPRYRPIPSGIGSDALAAVSYVGWPAVIKPRSESGSHHTFLATDLDHARSLLEMLGESREEMIAEEYLTDDPEWSGPYADYVSVESVVAHGKISHLAVTGRFPMAQMFRETGFCIPAAIEASTRDAALMLTGQAIDAVGVATGCTHTEVKFTAEGPRIIEVNGRLGGGIPDMLEAAANFSVLSVSLRIALGEAVSLDSLIPCDRVGYRFFLQPPALAGTVTAIEGISEFADRSGVDSLTIHRGPDARVDWRDGTRAFILAAAGTAETHKQAREIRQLLDDTVRVSYERDEVMDP